MDAAASNWRNQLEPETRQLLLKNIITKLKFGHLPGDYDEDLELQKIAHSIEQKSYAGATTQADYFDKIASKILLLEKAREREWRHQLHPESRQRIVNKITDTLRRHVPVSGPDGSQELWKIARRFEEKIFAAASSQSDYLRKISLKMLTMETDSQRNHQLGLNNQPANPDDTNPRQHGSRNRRMPAWTDDYHMG
ncbi:hypothetical protein PIB30_000127 [Stylosanthes scabra]|uniref:Mediator complex subunit 15 KIX domain-containing protein n=1 Tax=Stylosanthes scabra TaxID=79078 RepID=A0ABU6R261_9FABA|nr:hypothetical protein [Stylosanthes scabra]